MEYPRRKNLRLAQYDYSDKGTYFLTVCTKNRRCILASVGRDDLGAPMEMTAYGRIVEEYVCAIPTAYPDVVLEKYAIMPNHIHLLISLADGAAGSPRPTQRIPRIVSALKRLTNSSTGEKLWQVSYYDHVVRNDEDFRRIWEYIDTNPVRWLDDEYHM